MRWYNPHSSFLSALVIALIASLYIASIAGGEGQSTIETIAASVVLMICGAIYAMRIAIKYNIFGCATHLPAIIYLAIIVAFTPLDNSILTIVASIVMMLSMDNLYAGYTHNRSSLQLFSGCFWLGALPLLYPSTSPFGVLIFVILVLFERSERDILVALGAYATPFVIACYVNWLVNDDMSSYFGGVASAFANNGVSIVGDYGAIALVATSIAAVAFVIITMESWSLTLVARKRIAYAISLVICSLAMIAIPSFAPYHFAVIAAPVAIVISAILIKSTHKWSLICYILLITSVILAHVLP